MGALVVEDKDEYELIKLDTERGEVRCRYYFPYSQHPASVAVVYVTGVGGDWGTPAVGLYPRLCSSLARTGIDGLRVRYRHPTDLSEAVFDTLAGIAFLKDKHRKKAIGLVGHSFGGAVIIQAAVAAPDIVSTIVTLATQSYGAAESISKLNQGLSSLLIHALMTRSFQFIAPSRYISRLMSQKKLFYTKERVMDLKRFQKRYTS
jgi:pimeloyl-ACP methyl ester carboxylesterase